jgi:sodium/proline symporter
VDQAIIIGELALYLLCMLAIGVYFSRQKMTQAEYHLGGKKIKGWALALSERATGESAWLILGLTGAAYATGLPELWVVFGCVGGVIVSWLLLARRFRAEAERYGALTYVDYFTLKYKRRAGFIRWFASLVIIFFYTLYVYAQFEGGGKVLNQTFGIDPLVGIALSAVVTILYSMSGGFPAIVWTDVVQAFLMILTFIVTPIVAVVVLLGQDLSLGAALAATGTRGSLFGGQEGWGAFMLALAGFSWFFGYLGGQPQLSTRWMAMRNDRDVRQGTAIAIGWTLLAYAGAILIGLAAAALYGPNAVADPEQVLPFMLHQLLPAWLVGLLLVGAIAAMMSTASSQLLLITSSVAEDIVHKGLKKDYDDRKLVRISRVTLFAVGAVGLALALALGKPIFSVVSWAWAGIGCSFSPAIVLAFYWKRFSSAGVVASLVSGFAMTVVWMSTGLYAKLSVMLVSFVTSFACAIVASLIAPDPEEPR